MISSLPCISSFAFMFPHSDHNHSTPVSPWADSSYWLVSQLLSNSIWYQSTLKTAIHLVVFLPITLL